ncbi:MtnX-like HAD-IB family phosphatase [Melioribacteraceae bacterium 4301-Me]|uniref:MtnX-like HAD-IB family phosphatase n=1 Tax=Pyranulibacter aquaticus TaxID=3163344 RepID=UPI00359698AB
MLNKSTFKIFVDFDGTITVKDVGEEIFLHFGDPSKAKKIVKDWIDEKINSIQTWELLCKTVNNLSLEEFDSFIDSMCIQPTFLNFIDYCKLNNFQIWILSDGLDYYIKRILSKEKISYLNFYSNKLIFGKNNELIPFFPYTDEECKSCANCKRNHIIEHSSDDDFSVYIGDGYSDTCPAQFCDFIFAKNSLLKYCEKNRISYYPFKDFSDIIKKLEELKNKKHLRKRHQAVLKRKEVYMQG